LLYDRQDLVAENDEAKAELIAWLNGSPSGTGAIAKMREWLRENYWRFRQDDEQVTIYEDSEGIIVGSTQGSGGYVYVAGWLKPDRLSREDREKLTEIRRATEIGRMHDSLTAERYELVRGTIPAERWEFAYGWTAEQAAGMDGTSSEVRLYHVAADGTRREIGEDEASIFEFGYGGTGPHDSARAIVNDITLNEWAAGLAPAHLRELVPEVFTGSHDAERVTVLVADVAQRIEATC
jgi:hypothetical protein